MKHWREILGLGLTMLLVGMAVVKPANDPLAIGSPAPLADRSMIDVSGDTLTLNDVKGAQGLLVMFSCNTCPWVVAWEDRYPLLAREADSLGIGMILINSNEDYREKGDGMKDMKARAAEKGYTMPYLLDRESVMALAFGATRTPEAFLFDADLTLVYHGAIDDNAKKPREVEHTFLLDAMRNLAAGSEISPQETRSVGCTIKFSE